MNDLVEKVARAMCVANHGDPDEDMPNDGPRWKYWVPNARAAIAAAAEWLSEDPKAEQCCRDTISGALAAELKRIQK